MCHHTHRIVLQLFKSDASMLSLPLFRTGLPKSDFPINRSALSAYPRGHQKFWCRGYLSSLQWHSSPDHLFGYGLPDKIKNYMHFLPDLIIFSWISKSNSILLNEWFSLLEHILSFYFHSQSDFADSDRFPSNSCSFLMESDQNRRGFCRFLSGFDRNLTETCRFSSETCRNSTRTSRYSISSCRFSSGSDHFRLSSCRFSSGSDRNWSDSCRFSPEVEKSCLGTVLG